MLWETYIKLVWKFPLFFVIFKMLLHRGFEEMWRFNWHLLCVGFLNWKQSLRYWSQRWSNFKEILQMPSFWITPPFTACFEFPPSPYHMPFFFLIIIFLWQMYLVGKVLRPFFFGPCVWRRPTSFFVLGCVHVLNNPFLLCIWYVTWINLSWLMRPPFCI